MNMQELLKRISLQQHILGWSGPRLGEGSKLGPRQTRARDLTSHGSGDPSNACAHCWRGSPQLCRQQYHAERLHVVLHVAPHAGRPRPILVGSASRRTTAALDGWTTGHLNAGTFNSAQALLGDMSARPAGDSQAGSCLQACKREPAAPTPNLRAWAKTPAERPMGLRKL